MTCELLSSKFLFKFWALCIWNYLVYTGTAFPFRNFTEIFKNFCGSNLHFALFYKKNRENAPLWTGRAGQNGSVAKTKCFTDDHIFAFDRTIFNSWYSHWIAICKMFVSSSYSFKASCIHKLFFPSFQIECIYYSVLGAICTKTLQ